MRFIEIEGNLLMPISNEEMIIMERVGSSGKPLAKKELNEREREIARQMVTRGLLNRIKIEDAIYFVQNTPEALWRDR